MQYNKLGNTDINVSVICLGTMTYGEQNTEQDAFEQLDYAVSQGINFIDTAELYAIPPCAETYGLTESYIGNWLQARKNRQDIILATKIAGPGDLADHIRGGPRLTAEHIKQAIEDSLKRLQTDYIDLYQIHWPGRNTNFFGKLGYTADTEEAANSTLIEDTLSILADYVKSGAIRYIGVSNETPWGVMQYLKYAEQLNLPRIVSIQNPYSLLNRSYEVGLAEVSHREQCGLLAYSPLGFGVLSGKYLNDQQPEGARITRWPGYGRYTNDNAVRATQAYIDLAQKHDLKPVQMAIAYTNSRPFLTSTIIGATQMTQLQENIGSKDIVLSDEIIEGIDAIHKQISNPSP